MAIAESDLKLKKSERLTQTDDGGGFMTDNPVIDGEVNNLFPNISRFDRAAGRVILVKSFGHVDTNNTDPLSGTHMVVLQEPADPKVHITMFSTGSDQDERLAAKNFIESYVVQGPVTEMRLWDTQQQGQRVILAFKALSTPDPAIGDVLCLSIEAVGFDAHQQYVRILSWSKEERTFDIDGTRTIKREIVTIETSVPLNATFPGEDASTTAPLAAAKTKVRSTRAADAAVYYGVARLTEEVEPGDRIVSLDTIYSQIVPNTTTEQPVVNLPPASTAMNFTHVGEPTSVTASIALPGPSSVFTGNPIKPGSVSVVADGNTLVDVDGLLQYASGTGPWSGTINYEGGQLSLSRAGGAGSSSVTVTFRAAGVSVAAPYTYLYQVTQATRRFNYVFNAQPAPAPGTVRVSYMALGKWYELRDDGRGNIVGRIPATGSGTINYTTGSLIVTTAALPDVGSAILLSYADDLSIAHPQDAAEVLAPAITVDLEEDIDPDSVVITWNDGSPRTANGNSDGTISGSATGTIVANGGLLIFRPTSISAETEYTIEYTTYDRYVENHVVPDVVGEWTITLPNAPLEPGSIVIQGVFKVRPQGGGDTPMPDRILSLHDNGAGALRFADGTNAATINYTTGVITGHSSTAFTLGEEE